MTSGAIQREGAFDLMRMDRRIGQRLLRRRIAKLAAWSGLVAVGITRGGFFGWLGSGIGLFGIAAEVGDWLESRPEWQKGELPGARLLRTSHVNSVDRASSESFPASDAPAPRGN
jgi:hypothetical protein